MPADPKATSGFPSFSDPEGRVVLFRPRAPARDRMRRPTTAVGDPERARNRWPEPWEDYYGDEGGEHPRRNLFNLIGVGCTLLLIGAGLWLAHAIAEMRTIEDCVLSGRSNCAPIEINALRR
jgi:hypothetical protein